MQRALDFLQEHNEVALATVCNNKPELRVFQIGSSFFFLLSGEKLFFF